MKTIKSTLKLLTITALVLSVPSFVFAQQYGGMGGMGMGGMGMGMGMGYGGMGMGMGGDGGPASVATVKYGEKIYDAVFGDLIDYKVYYIQVPADTIGVHYFDDGVTMNDEVAYDGMPSNITINRNTYLGPFSIRYKRLLSKAVEKAKEMGAIKFYNLGVTSDSTTSKVANMKEWNGRLTEMTEGFISDHVAQFEGYDEATYIKAVDPSLFESMEGFGGGGGGMGAGGFLPDMPYPPGLPNPMESSFGESANESDLGTVIDIGSQPASPPAQRFNPMGRANATVDMVNTMSQF